MATLQLLALLFLVSGLGAVAITPGAAQVVPPPRAEEPVRGTPQPTPKRYDHRPYDRMQAIKTAFWAPMWGHYSLGYERMLDVNLGIDMQAGFIDDNRSQSDYSDYLTAKGFYLLGGVKYLMGPDKQKQAHLDDHTMDGWFVIAQLAYSRVQRQEAVSYYPSGNYNQAPATSMVETIDNYGALLLGAGFQKVLRNRLLLQTYATFGYGRHDQQVASGPTVDTFATSPYSYSGGYVGDTDPPMAYSHLNISGRAALRLTFNLGWCF